jgi:hypothetical protein
MIAVGNILLVISGKARGDAYEQGSKRALHVWDPHGGHLCGALETR